MAYKSPIEDTQFILENLLPPHNELDNSTIDAVLGEAGKLADNFLAPLNHYGDKNNPILRQDHEVETPKGFSNAFSEIAKGGWIGVASFLPHLEGLWAGGECLRLQVSFRKGIPTKICKYRSG